MKRIIKLFFILFLCIISICSVSDVKKVKAENYLYLSGEIFGFSLVSKGVTVIGISSVITEDRTYSPAKEAGIKTGDVITKINGKNVTSDTNIDENLIEGYNEIELIRENSFRTVLIKPAKDVNKKLRLGLFLRKDINGLGTISFYNENGRFLSLGHEIYSDNSKITQVEGGNTFDAKITSIVKSTKGSPGEIQGFLKNKKIGNVSKLIKYGLIGEVDNFDKNKYTKIGFASNNEISIGNAKIYSNVSGEFKYYDISILKTNFNNDSKNFVIRIEDENLLSLTGGIVQGMSGTPIIQNGKIAGIITHVFVSSPNLGYGISISKTLDYFK